MVTWWRQIVYINERMLTKDTDFLRLLLNLYKVKMIFVTELTFGYLSLKNPILRDKCSVKGKIALVRKLAILGRRWTHVPKNQFLTANEGARGVRGRGRCAEQLRKLVTQWFDQHHLNCFKYNLQLWGQIGPISLRPVHGIVQDGAAMSWRQYSHHIINFFHLMGVSVFKGCGSDYYLQPLRKN